MPLVLILGAHTTVIAILLTLEMVSNVQVRSVSLRQFKFYFVAQL